MASTIIVDRPEHIEELRLAFKAPSIRLIHIYGIAGVGKTTIARQLLTQDGVPTLEFQCRLKMQLDLRSLMDQLERATLTARQIETLHRRKRDALIASGYENASRSHRISLKGSAKIIAQGDVFAGDKIQKSDAQYHRELFEECRLRLELLADLIRPFDKPVCTIFLDSLEAIDETNDPFCQWLSANVIEPVNGPPIPLRIVTTSRLRRTFDCSTGIRRQVRIGAMSRSEAQSLLQRHGISSEKTVAWLISITRAHPQALVLASRLSELVDMDSLELPSRSSAVYEELCTEILLQSILEREGDELLRRAMTTIPVLRFFTAEQVSAMLNCSNEETERVVTKLKEAGCIESTQTVLKYHDLLRELTLKFLEATRGSRAVRMLHLQAAASFQRDPENTSLLSVVEPFYHLLNGDIARAVEYSEQHIKPALDRRERTLAAILLNQIEFDSLPDTPSKGWLLLRHGGYHREFRDFPRAVQVFEKIPGMVGTDDRLLASVLNNLGWVYLYWGGNNHAVRAIELFERSNAICRRHGYVDILAMNLNNMGIGYSHMTKSDGRKEIECYEQCLVITEDEQTRNYLVSGMAFQNAGLVYHKRHDYGRASAALSHAFERFRHCRCPQREGEMVYLLARVLFDSKEYTKSRAFLDFSLNAFRSQPDCDPYYLGENFFALARVLDRLGEHDSMRQCLLSMLTISLSENVQYHIIVAQRAVQFCRCLFAVHGKDLARDTLEHLAEQWSISDIGRNVPQLPDFLASEIKTFERCALWSNGRSRVAHEAASSRCKPTRWDHVVIRESDNDGTVLCRRCGTTKAVSHLSG